jgi:hypothetical protein
MSRKVGYWLSEKGAVPVERDHAETVLADPEQFELDRESLMALYRKHDESPGSEGFARDEVIRMAAKKGWIRVRIQNSTGNYVMLQGYEPERHLERISSFLCDLVHRDIIAADETIVLSDFASASTKTLHWTDGGAASVMNNGCLDL